jgi:hypothetical protein
MDNTLLNTPTPQGALQDPWDHYYRNLEFTDEAQPTQTAPFFQSQGNFIPGGNASKGNIFSGGPTITQPHLSQPIGLAFGQDSFALSQRQRMREPSQPHQAKRQKLTGPGPAWSGGQPTLLQPQHAYSAAESQSDCCSSCSGGIPCAEPYCAPCSKPDCDGEVTVIPCSNKSCEQPACTDSCLSTGIQTQQLDNSAIPPERRMSKLVDDPWTAQIRRDNRLDRGLLHDMIDSALQGFIGPEYASASASPAPSTPSMANNVPTPYTPNNELPTLQHHKFPPQTPYLSQSNSILSGAGAMFNPATESWVNDPFHNANNGNDSSIFHCSWNGCEQPFPTYQDWFSHLHCDHVDPQMTFGCPIQGDTCPPTIGTNPLDHLQTDHGFNFDMNSSGFSCPAPTCLPGETFCNPAMLHNHFDYAHATPAQGSLQCRLNACDTSFPDQDRLFSHIIDYHQLPPPLQQQDDDIDLSVPPAPSLPAPVGEKNPLARDEVNSLEPDTVNHRCKWVENDGYVCIRIFTTEQELQNHIKIGHLEKLDKHSGYKCQWEGCVRHEKRGANAGFSQRGKLERHMATHTNCKLLPLRLRQLLTGLETNPLHVISVVKHSQHHKPCSSIDYFILERSHGPANIAAKRFLSKVHAVSKAL